MLDDSHIVSELKNGNKAVFETLFRSYYEGLARYAYSILKDYDSAEEVVQDLFCRIWHNRASLNVGTSLKGYLFTSTRNSCLHHLSHLKVVERHASTLLRETEEASDQVNEGIYYAELLAAVKTVLDVLPERAAKIFEMNRFEGKKYHEIADDLSISVKTVEADMGKALKEFRKAFNRT